MTHAELLAKIEEIEGELETLKLRRDPAQLRLHVRQAQAEAEVLEKRLSLSLPNDRPPPKWVPGALLALPVMLIVWLWFLAKVVR